MVTTVSLESVMLDSAKEVFASMIFIPLDRAAEAAPESQEMEFLATITFTGDLEGCFGICCEGPCAQAVARGMLCLEPDAALGDSEVTDAIGEVANMVMGGIKTRVQNESAKIEISIPSVIYGRQIKNRLGERMSRVAIPVTIGEHRAELSLVHRSHNS